jgi:hypothetical protein
MTEFHVADAAVRQLHARYCDAAYRKDYDSFGDCFTEDCEWRIGGAILKGRSNIVDHAQKVFARFKRIFVTLRTPILDVGDGVASARTYLTEQNVLNDGTSIHPIGIYFERFVDCGDRWRFKWRLFQTHYVGPADLSGNFYDQPDYGAPPNMPAFDATTLDVTGSHTRKD